MAGTADGVTSVMNAVGLSSPAVTRDRNRMGLLPSFIGMRTENVKIIPGTSVDAWLGSVTFQLLSSKWQSDSSGYAGHRHEPGSCSIRRHGHFTVRFRRMPYIAGKPAAHTSLRMHRPSSSRSGSGPWHRNSSLMSLEAAGNRSVLSACLPIP